MHRLLVDSSRNVGLYWMRLALYAVIALQFGLFWFRLDWVWNEGRLK
jgi:hypothetical protein